ncbi:MAG: zinc-finger protein [Candelina mexicana]|nr:MAG: zinc-finger protein [Candelina mexicana]
MATDGRLPTQHHWFTTAGGAALHPPREGTSSNDQEYYFKHTGVLDQLDQSHVHQGSGDLDIKGVGWVDGYSYQPAKRRRTFEGDSGIDFGRLALQSPIEQQIQPQIDTTANPIHCQWGEHCNQSFFDWNTLEGHVQSTHITTQPTVQCHWNGCEEPTHPSMVLSHVKRKHDFEDQHVCLWGGCSQAFTDHRELEQHLQNAHAPPNSLLCEWDRCGLVAEDPFDLKEHLQIDHCFDPRFMTLDSEAGTGQPGLPHGMQPKQCAWTEGDGNNGDAITCGLMFDDAEALHTHIKAAHTDRLNQKLGYFCQWKDCDRRGFGRFSQKGKLERHVQVHTGCVWQPA